MRETQQSISEWAAATFGDGGSDFRVATRANEEMAELLRAIGSGAPTAKIIEEAADVAIVLMRLASRVGAQIEPPFASSLPSPSTSSLYELASDANKMMASTIENVACDWQGVCADELPELLAYLAAICALVDGDLCDAIDATMDINRERVWKKDGTGHGYHVRKKEDA